jgi:hypothetical protein
VESAIAGKRFTLIEQTKGCHESMAPFFLSLFADTKKLYAGDLVNGVVIGNQGILEVSGSSSKDLRFPM